MSTQDQITLSRRGVIEASAALGLAAALPASATAAEGALSATINATNIGPPLSPLLYGGFLEHIGGLINANLWSELLDDRKFYYGVLETLEPPPTGFLAASD